MQSDSARTSNNNFKHSFQGSNPKRNTIGAGNRRYSRYSGNIRNTIRSGSEGHQSVRQSSRKRSIARQQSTNADNVPIVPIRRSRRIFSRYRRCLGNELIEIK